MYINIVFLDYTEGAELVDSVLDVVRKEAEGTDCLQGELSPPATLISTLITLRFPNHPLPRRRHRCRYGHSFDFEDP